MSLSPCQNRKIPCKTCIEWNQSILQCKPPAWDVAAGLAAKLSLSMFNLSARSNPGQALVSLALLQNVHTANSQHFQYSTRQIKNRGGSHLIFYPDIRSAIAILVRKKEKRGLNFIALTTNILFY